MAGAVALVLTKQVDFNVIGRELTANTAINPLKILVLFLSMTILSIYLDELGFFSYLANKTLEKAGKSQLKLFLYLYLIVSLLTVFTSNDIIILSFTPFICYFAKNARINAMPYLAAEFVAANTWSMALIIGNPTNIYLATANGIGFLTYLKVMALPTLAAGSVALLLLYLMFRKQLLSPIKGRPVQQTISDRLSLWVGIVHLALCTVALSVSSYIGWEMWLIAACSVGSLVVWCLIIDWCRHHAPNELLASLRRAPWPLVPFVLSMFVMTIALTRHGVTAEVSDFLGSGNPLLGFGLSSFFASNVINNIPVSVLFSSVIGVSSPAFQTETVYAAIVGSNVGAFPTPIGALAGIIRTSILSHHGLRFTYFDFLKWESQWRCRPCFRLCCRLMFCFDMNRRKTFSLA